MYNRKGDKIEIAKKVKEFYRRGIDAKDPESRRAFWSIARHWGQSGGMSFGELYKTMRRAQDESNVSSEEMIKKFKIDTLRHELRKKRKENYENG